MSAWGVCGLPSAGTAIWPGCLTSSIFKHKPMKDSQTALFTGGGDGTGVPVTHPPKGLKDPGTSLSTQSRRVAQGVQTRPCVLC
jgi:hypothetical protein